jgi:HEAT repeat protein
VAIRSSSAREIDSLIADLTSERPVVRETALARLTVIGPRAVVHLVGLVENTATPPSTRLAALRALDAIDDVRAIDVARSSLSDADLRVAVAAAGVLQRFLTGSRGVEVTDALTAKALDRDAEDAVRLAALVALEDLGRVPLEPLWKALAQDSSRSVRAHVAQAGTGHAEVGDVVAADDPEKLRRELSMRRTAPTVAELQGLIDRIRSREESETGPQRDAWRRARGAAHVALARRGSRLALYDLRESLERAKTPLPVEFMAALSLAGDATCLEAIAAAHSHAVGPENEWWRDHLADTFRAIVQRERLTGRNAVMKKIRKRWPAILSTTSRT